MVSVAPKLTARDGEIFQAVGYNRELKCEVTGNPVPTEVDLTWYKEGAALEAGNK